MRIGILGIGIVAVAAAVQPPPVVVVVIVLNRNHAPIALRLYAVRVVGMGRGRGGHVGRELHFVWARIRVAVVERVRAERVREWVCCNGGPRDRRKVLVLEVVSGIRIEVRVGVGRRAAWVRDRSTPPCPRHPPPRPRPRNAAASNSSAHIVAARNVAVLTERAQNRRGSVGRRGVSGI